MKRSVTRTLVTAAAAAALTATGAVGVAHADPPLLNGSYTGDGGSDEFSWNITPSCGASGCTETVASNQGWTSIATFDGVRWNFRVTKPDGAICDDGSYAPAYISLSIDPITLDGTVSSDSNYGCPGGVISQSPFKLRKIG